MEVDAARLSLGEEVGGLIELGGGGLKLDWARERRSAAQLRLGEEVGGSIELGSIELGSEAEAEVGVLGPKLLILALGIFFGGGQSRGGCRERIEGGGRGEAQAEAEVGRLEVELGG
ncbi:unnamed protein product [Calypogeia fissa]